MKYLMLHIVKCLCILVIPSVAMLGLIYFAALLMGRGDGTVNAKVDAQSAIQAQATRRATNIPFARYLDKLPVPPPVFDPRTASPFAAPTAQNAPASGGGGSNHLLLMDDR